ncbi:glycoside hydrolase family 2 protein [Winogradskyella sp. DF17]|uniref:Beta-mannosidase B n=1 Tax=Winogradskyella pelagia TaxID=2819984 RepID=A0ABS3SYI4_9FLAO|nr:glycoside hydrolase family 2 protein [Winogradskyella sp. DF17]MBO3115529.1 glycoside hydrolase family 2 protein [Winogradskyella sp. DF17]
MRYSVVFILAFILGCQPKYDVPQTIELHLNWQFRKAGDSIWNSATVPGNVFSDLMKNGLIEDPFIGDNEQKVQWVSEEDWEYRTTFLADEETLQKKNVELNFEGLDTYASVFLNDSLILKTNNAFREFKVNVKPLLKSENELRILFESTSKYEEKEKQKLPYDLPEGERIFTRKAQFQYGWDWGPKLNTSGIWRPIELIAWDDFKFQNLFINQLKLSEKEAALSINLNDNGQINPELQFDVFVNDSLFIEFKNPNALMPTQIPITIQNPKLWWPHNLGEPYLYAIKVVVKDDERILDSISTPYGIRDIELVTEKDSIGESFYFKVNGKPVYAKGTNYIPQNSFQNKVTATDYENLLNDVVEANMNMLRVWGGGIYENDIFYDLCDEKGILVWQDFMFACAMYPGDDAFLENVKQEAIDNVKRLRNHASMALWCGNNENSEGWYRWGWQNGRSEREKEEIWNNYLKVFDSILPLSVAQLTDTDYWESSPKYGRGNPKHKTEGDAHDWWVWHDGYAFEHLDKNVPRFMSEFGFQSLPNYETIRYINQSDSIEIFSKGFKNHQKHLRGFELIRDYMERDFPMPKDATDYVYISQLLQAYGIAKGIEAHRRARPHNMGTLYWQLNDCWPSVSWSSIDFLGNWKALHYKAKRSFENRLVSTKVENDTLQVWIVNDDLKALKENLKIKAIDFLGKVLQSYNLSVNVASASSNLVFKLPLKGLEKNLNEMAVITEFQNLKRVHWLVSPKNLYFKTSPIRKHISQNKDGFSIELSSKTLQKDVFLFTDTKGRFSDNFFDMLPNTIYTIMFETSESFKDLHIKSFNNFIR